MFTDSYGQMPMRLPVLLADDGVESLTFEID